MKLIHVFVAFRVGLPEVNTSEVMLGARRFATPGSGAGCATSAAMVSNRTPALALVALVLFLGVLAAPLRAQACSVCGSDDPLMAVGDSAPTAGALRVSLAFSWLSATARSDDDPLVSEAISRATLAPTVVYSPLSRLNLAFSLPFLRNRYRATGGSDEIALTLTGLSDAELGLRYFAWQHVDFAARRRQEFAISAGSALPSGKNSSAVDGERLDEHAQLGRGAFGPHLGVLYALHQDPFHFSADATLRAYTENHYGYRYGEAALWNAVGQWAVAERFAFGLGLSGRYAVRDRQSGETQANTGGFVVQAVPGLAFGITSKLWLKARAELPFVRQLFGEQTLGATYRASLEWAP